MSERLDPETLAALIEGRLSGAARTDALRQLADSPEDYAVFLDATALVEATQVSPDTVVGSRPSVRSSWIRRAALAVPVLAAAGLLLFVWPPWSRNEGEALAFSLLADPCPIPVDTECKPAIVHALRQERGWSRTRGSGEAMGGIQAYRIGAQLADVRFWRATDDSAGIATSLADLGALLQTVPGGPLILERVQRLDDGSQLDQEAGALRREPWPAGWFDAGVWISSARIAIAVRRFEWFDASGPPMTQLRRIVASLDADQGGLNASEQRALADVLRRLLSVRISTEAGLEGVRTFLEAGDAAGGAAR